MLSIFIPWHKTPLIPPIKTTIKVFYAGVIFETLWYVFLKLGTSTKYSSNIFGARNGVFVQGQIPQKKFFS
jgi:hypothetical protein